MQINVDERPYLTLVRLSGRVANEDRQKLATALDEVLRSDPLAMVLDLASLDEIPDLPLASLCGALAYLKLRGDPCVLIGVPRPLAERLRRAGVGLGTAMVSDEQEACLALLERIPKRYDELFCKLLVQEGHLAPERLKEALLLFEREGRSGDFGRLLLRERLVSAPQILDAICRQKALLGDILVGSGKLTQDELDKVLRAQLESGATREKLGDLLLRLGMATNEDIYEALARQFKRRKRLQKPSGGAAAGRRPAPPARPATQSARLGEILLEQRLLTPEDLERSLQLQRQTQGREKLGDILVRLGFVSDSDLYRALLTQFERSQPGEVSGEVRTGLEALIAKMGNPDHLVARQAAEGLLALGTTALSVVMAAVRNPSPPIRRGAIDLLGDAYAFEAIPALLEKLEDAVPKVRFEARWALTRITGQGFAPGDLASWHGWWRTVDPGKLPRPADRISTHREEMARLLARALESRESLDAFDLEYRAGHEEWEGGHVRLQLRGDGLVQVFQAKRGEMVGWAGDLGRAEAGEAMAAYASAGILFMDTGRTVDDGGETRHELALRIGNRYLRRSLLYYRELFNHWNFRSYEARLRELLRRVTRGAVF